MTDVSVSDASDDTSALTVRPGLWPIWVGAEGEKQTPLWVVVGGFDAGGYWVEDGFITDLATIPKVVHWLFNPFSPETAVPAAGHDWLLQCGVDERVAAGQFYELMRDWNVPKWKRQVYFWAVLIASKGW